MYADPLVTRSLDISGIIYLIFNFESIFMPSSTLEFFFFFFGCCVFF